MTAHSASAHFAGAGSLTADATVVVRPEELPAALRQHEKPVVIENTPANARLRRDFKLLLKWQRWKDTNRLLWLAALVFIVFMQMVMTNRYGLEFGWYFKSTVIELGGKITLTSP